MKTIMKTYHFLELLLGLDDALPVVAVHDEDESLGVLEVVAPEWPDLVLNRKYIEWPSTILFCWKI